MVQNKQPLNYFIMTITSEVKNQFFDKSTNKVITLPRSAYPGVPIAPAPNSASNSPVSGGANGTNGTPWTGFGSSPAYSPSMVDASLSDVHLTGNLLDEILMSLFEDNGGEPIEITQEDLGALMSFQ
uniref:Uncharacterized protein n=1 Tax=Globisporangium ultimum (strain ATCC 200006 / CBS 805.95 / DAOM BR144) TaxID=431595 RepID=K3WD07_GLOUD